jgi:hypothetical protein
MAVLRSHRALPMVMAVSASLRAEGEAPATHQNRDGPTSGQHFSNKSLVFSITYPLLMYIKIIFNPIYPFGQKKKKEKKSF